MFIRKKGGCYYMVENRRENGKIRQKVLACLGRQDNLEGAVAHGAFWLAETHAPLAWDHYKKFPNWHRKARRLEKKLGLYFDTFCRKRYPGKPWRELWKDQLSRHAYFTWRNEGIDAHLQAEHEKYLKDHQERIAKYEASLSTLWLLIPENERAAAIPRIQAQIVEEQKDWARFVGTKQGWFVVSQESGKLIISYSAECPLPVVPELSPARATIGITQVGGNVVPNLVSRVDEVGTTQEWYGA